MGERPRIIAGIFKGKKLHVPEDARPVTDRVKSVIFDTLSDYIKDTVVLDIFAGSGNLGIEALSRGAARAYFVDSNEDAIKTIEKNIADIGKNHEFPLQTTILKSFHDKFLRDYKGEKFNLIFLDPPFSLVDKVNLDKFEPVLDDKGILIFKSNKNKIKKLNNLKIVLEKKVGINFLYFLSK